MFTIILIYNTCTVLKNTSIILYFLILSQSFTSHLNIFPLHDAQLSVVPGHEFVNDPHVQRGLTGGVGGKALTVGPAHRRQGGGSVGQGRRLPAIIELWDVRLDIFVWKSRPAKGHQPRLKHKQRFPML